MREEVAHNNNIQNLIPTTERTEKELREMTRKGGIKSGQVRREKRDLKQALLWMLSLNLGKDEEKKLNDILGTKDKMTQADAVAFAALSKARSGETPSIRLLSEMMGFLETKNKTTLEVRQEGGFTVVLGKNDDGL